MFLAVLLVACSALSARAETPLKLDPAETFYEPLTAYMAVYIDPAAAMDIADVIENPSHFRPVTTKYPDFGLTQGRVWLRTPIVNAAGSDGRWRLDINRQYYAEIAVYMQKQDGPPVRLLRYTNDNTFYDRPIPDRMLVVDFDLEDGAEADIYIGFRSDSTSYLPAGIGTAQGVVNHRSQENTINWVLNGALLAIIFFALMMIPVIGWRLSISFSLYIFAGLAFVFHADGYTFAHFWPGQKMVINDPLNLSFMALMPVFGLMFARAMFDFKTQALRFDRCLLAYIGVAVLIALTSFPIYQVQAVKVVAYFAPLIGSVLQLAAGTIAIRKKLLGAVPFMVGAVIVMVSLIYALIAHVFAGYFSLDATLDFGHVSVLAECFAFAAAIVIRLSTLQIERDRALQAELISANEKLRLSSDLQKSQTDYFHARKMSDLRRKQLSSVSHDLQQPLGSLRSALSAISGADEDATQKISAAFDYLENLAREQLTDSHSGALNLQIDGTLESFPVNTLLDNVYEMFKDEATEKGLDFRYRPINAAVTSDPIAVMRALNNLVSNAIKHTASGSVLLSARRAGHAVRIEVIDQGAGLSSEALARMKQRRAKGPESSGTGLGLSIVQDISDRLALDFTLESRVGKGTTAGLTLPLYELPEMG